MILICCNELAGSTGYHKSVVENANGLHRGGHDVAVLSFQSSRDGSYRMKPLWPLDDGITALALQTLAAQHGRLLYRDYHPVLTGTFGANSFSFTANELEALRQLNAQMSEADTIIFTTPLLALAYHHGLQSDERRPRTVLQVHGDYLHHVGLWDMMMEARPSIDQVQTVSSGLREQFIPTFAASHVSFVPNFPGAPPAVERREHEGVNIVLPASYQERKNQLDAVRALAEIDDPSVRLTLWGVINERNPYYIAVRDLVRELGLEERVSMPGFGTEQDVYCEADILLMTSLSEGLPYPLIEAASRGIPAVAYDFDFGPRDAIRDGDTGYIVPLNDVDSLAARLKELVSDSALRSRFGENALDLYQQRFSEAEVRERYRALLGAPGGTTMDLAELTPDGVAPVDVRTIQHRVCRLKGRTVQVVSFRSIARVRDLQADNGLRVRSVRALRLGRSTHLAFVASGEEVLSYTRAGAPHDRHYLAHTTSSGTLEVLPYLRRDRVPGVRMATVAVPTQSVRSSAARLRRDVVWKLRQIVRRGRRST